MSHDPSSRDALSRNSLDVGPTASLCGCLGCPHSDISPSLFCLSYTIPLTLRLGVSHKAFTETYCTAAHCVLCVLLQAAPERDGEHVSLYTLLPSSYPHGAFWIVTCFLFPWRVMESASLVSICPFFIVFYF